SALQGLGSGRLLPVTTLSARDTGGNAAAGAAVISASVDTGAFISSTSLRRMNVDTMAKISTITKNVMTGTAKGDLSGSSAGAPKMSQASTAASPTAVRTKTHRAPVSDSTIVERPVWRAMMRCSTAAPAAVAMRTSKNSD